MLTLAGSLFEKGVPEIRQRGGDTYYRRLMILHGDRLQQFLDGLADNSSRLHSYGLDALKAIGDFGDHDDEVPLALPDSAADDGDVGDGNAMFAIEAEVWKRCVAHVGGDSFRLKVYFDNFSGSTGKQRGLFECRAHACRKHVPVFRTRVEFCAWAYAWEIAGALVPQADHACYVPLEAHVQAILADLVLDDF